MALNLTGNAIRFLKDHPDERFTAKEIALWIFHTYPDECRSKKERSVAEAKPMDSDTALIQQLVREIYSRKLEQKDVNIKATEERPHKYYYTLKTDLTEVEEAENDENPHRPTREADLYPVLSNFLWSELGIYSKRINEKKSHNKNGAGGNKWLYPDVVAVENLSTNWHLEIKKCVEHYTDRKTRLWSFEVKILLNRSNIRESFFQAVSNSSWANFTWLVASEISGSETIQELRLLSGLHGVGIIHLDKDNPSESQILIPAKERPDIDWHNANRLAGENKDFLDYIRLIRHFYQTGDIRRTDWDMSQENS